MRTRHVLWSALMGIALALSGCAKDDIQTNTGEESGSTRTQHSLFTLEQAKACVTEQGGSVYAPDLGGGAVLLSLNWEMAQAFETEGIKGYYVTLSGNMSPILEAFGGTACSASCGGSACDGENCDPSPCECADGHCGHDHHATPDEDETTAVSTLFLKKNQETGEVSAYVQTNIRNTEDMYYILYSSLAGEVMSGTQTANGATTPYHVGISMATRGYEGWCDICGVWESSGNLSNHPKCHNCLNYWSSCTCNEGGGGGTDPVEPDGPYCPICGAIGDPRCSTSESTCAGWRCGICGKLGNVDYDWNVRIHGRKHCEAEWFCRCLCSVCGMHPDFCKCCNVCHQYPCVCVWDSTLVYSPYTPPVGLDPLHITVPKADIRMALNALHRH